jgi:hypothetical protein
MERQPMVSKIKRVSEKTELLEQVDPPSSTSSEEEKLETSSFSISEISNLISVRSYIYFSVENQNLKKSDINELQKIVYLIDKKLVSLILSNEFRAYITE